MNKGYRNNPFLLFIIVESISFLNSIPRIIQLVEQGILFLKNNSFTIFFFVGLLQIFLYLSLIISIILFLKKTTKAFILYYIQFVFRFLYFSMSFGIILRLKKLISSSFVGNLLVTLVVILEIARLIYTIFMHKKMRQKAF